MTWENVTQRTTSKSETVKKTTSTSSSSDPKKLPNKSLSTRTQSNTSKSQEIDVKKPLTKLTTKTSSVSSTSKDEDRKKVLSSRTVTQTSSGGRLTNGTVPKPSPGKAPLSRSSSTSTSITAKVKSRLTPERQSPHLKPKSAATPTKAGQNKHQVSSKANLVMSTVHNVTVSSPPSKRRELPEPIVEAEEVDDRRRVRSSKPAESPALKPAPKHLQPSVDQPVKVKEPVAFEVVFDEAQKPTNVSKTPASPDSSPDYDDDFESYESDFETGSSSAEVASATSSSTESSPREQSSTAESSETEPEVHSEDDEESEITQFPITVIHRDKEQERKLDSGHYDLHSKKRRAVEIFDSLDTLANYEQMDSGISYENSIPSAPIEPGTVAFCGYAGFYQRPVVTKRGVEIMSKIQFDVITFTLLDLKPIPYDTYMRMFGSFNTLQSSTQTQEDRMESECQTEISELRSVWTQHPPQYTLASAQGPICSGEGIDDEQPKVSSSEDQFDRTLKELATWRHNKSSSDNTLSHKLINYERLNAFLKSSSLLISRVLSSNAPDRRLTTTDLPALSQGFYNLNTHLLNALRVVRVFANHRFNLILTVHESIANVYQNDFSNLIMVWNSEDPSKPVRLLSTWSEVCQAEICNESSDIIVCGLRDGSVAMWDLRETYSFCSKLDGYLTHFAATHSIAPNLEPTQLRTADLGAVIDVKSFRPAARRVTGDMEAFKTVQFASLNETGILTIWTLVETGARSYEITPNLSSKFEYSSPWARVKLIQSAICDLREFMEFGNTRPKSAFERTKLNFQMDIFQDDVLKELAATQTDMKLGLQGLRFINLDCGTELIFVGTNRNYIVSCSKTLKRERFRKLTIAGGGFLFPTAIKLLQNENFLAIGLSNGSVTLLNCNQDETNKQQKISKNSERRPETSQSRTSDFEFEVGKSCAIQNIIRNERLPPERRFVDDNFRPSTAALIEATSDGGKKPFELRIFDEQMLLNGSVLRKDLVRRLEVSSDGWTLLALSKGNLRVYDFYAEKEVSFLGERVQRKNFMEITVTRGLGKEKKLVLLTESNDVEVHLLK